MTRLPSIALLVSFLVTTPLSITPARAADVDLALVLAVDVSSSVNKDRYQLQMRGFAQAFRSPDVIGAIQQGPQGAIAVTLVQWASYGDYRRVVDWTIIRDRTSASQFADAVVETFRALEGSTSLSGAIDVSVTLLQSSSHNARRKVIDISGDGSNNSGRPAGDARDDAVAAGITINGLPILTEEPAASLVDILHSELHRSPIELARRSDEPSYRQNRPESDRGLLLCQRRSSGS